MLKEDEIKTWIEKLTSDKEVQDLIKQLGITPQNEAQLWIKLLSVLNREESPMEEIKSKGLFYFIQTHCDLENGEKISELYEKIKKDEGFWNESLQDLSDFFQKEMSLEDNQVILETTKDGITDNKTITIATLKDSDAAYSFENQWVNPWRNVDGDSYDEVRKKDEVLDILKNANKLQYTREKKKEAEEKIDKWLRLIMPQYGRRVEIEDLDRNFWVIGQTIAAISNYLFGKEAPLPSILQGALREITELWENTLYLWLTAAMISQKGSGKVKIIVLPLPSRSNENGRHYDNIDSDDNICSYEIKDGYVTITNNDAFNDMIKERIKYLRDQYFNESLCVVPYIRLHNYKHNYYSMEYYPVICTSVARSEEWVIQPITEIFNEKEYPLVISPEVELEQRYTPYLYSTKQDYLGSVAWQYPFSTVGLTPAPSRFMMYATLRTIPNIQCTETNNEIKINDFALSVYDASAELITGKSRLMGTYIMNKDNPFKLKYNNADKQGAEKENLLNNLAYTEIEKGYYLGEVASWRDKTASIHTDDNIFVNQAYVIKIGSFMPAGTKTFKTADLYGYYTSMRGNITTNNYTYGDSILYFPYKWETYRESIINEQGKKVVLDGDSNQLISQVSQHCYAEDPKGQSSSYFTESQLREDGYIAAINFLAKQTEGKTFRYQSPCYILTSVGLTPWNGAGGTIYWDVGGICHIYLYIPHPQILCPEAFDKKLDDKTRKKYNIEGYEKEYNKDDYNPDTHNNIRKVLRSGKEVGKIISCQPVGQYESFCYMMENYSKNAAETLIGPNNRLQQDVYTLTIGPWRQFFVENTSENNKCKRITYNGGPTEPDGKVVYSATFSPIFNGTVSYYDARWNQGRGVPLPNKESLVSYGEVQIDSNGVTQSTNGFIHFHGSAIIESTQRAVDPKNTNFPMPLKTDKTPSEGKIPIFSRIPKTKTKINNRECYGTVKECFHGVTPLNGISSENLYYD